MDKTLRRSTQVARRRLVADIITGAGVLLFAASALSVASVLLAKFTAFPEVPWWGHATLGGIAIVGSLLLAMRRRWSNERSARELDRVLGFNDTLGSALELRASHREHERPFVAELAVRAERFAQTAKVDRAVRVRFGQAWLVWPLVGAAAYACFAWIPDRAQQSALRAQKRAQEIREATVEIRDVAKMIEDSGQSSAPEEMTRPLDDKLSEIEQELAAGRLTPHDARVRTAEELSRHAEETEKRAKQNEASVEEARRALARAAARARQAASPGGTRLAEAMRNGDLESAAQELERLDRSTASMEREQAARELEQISKNLDSGNGSGVEERSSDPGERMQQDSISDRLQRAASDASEELRRSPEESQPKPSETKPGDSNGERPSSDNKDRKDQTKQNSDSESKNGSDSNARTQRGNENPGRSEGGSESGDKRGGDKPEDKEPSAKPDSSSGPAQQGSKDQSGKGERPNQQPGNSGTQPQKRSDQEQPDQNQTSQNPPSPNGQQKDQSRQGSAPQESSRPAERGSQSGETGRDAQNTQGSKSPERSGSQPQPNASGTQSQSQGGQSGQEQNPPGASNPTQRPGEGQPAGSQRPTGSGAARQQPSGDSQGGATTPRSDSGPDGGAQRLARELRDLANQRQNAQQQRETARGLRDRAEQMLEKASPEERARLQELARRLAENDRANPGGAPAPWRGPTQTFDARPPTPDPNSKPIDDSRPSERTIAEWLSEPKPGGTAPAGAIPQEPIRRATESARQAIEQQTIPPQYSDLVRRVFKRYSESAQDSGAKK